MPRASEVVRLLRRLQRAKRLRRRVLRPQQQPSLGVRPHTVEATLAQDVDHGVVLMHSVSVAVEDPGPVDVRQYCALHWPLLGAACICVVEEDHRRPPLEDGGQQSHLPLRLLLLALPLGAGRLGRRRWAARRRSCATVVASILLAGEGRQHRRAGRRGGARGARGDRGVRSVHAVRHLRVLVVVVVSRLRSGGPSGPRHQGACGDFASADNPGPALVELHP
mmetsp:Transcript_116204/g.339915  ORF Transcript_116204/g.339915 Transcript_116204/m.339915 type:complete len:222 (-) Transcript_116204:101-766(-)